LSLLNAAGFEDYHANYYVLWLSIILFDIEQDKDVINSSVILRKLRSVFVTNLNVVKNTWRNSMGIVRRCVKARKMLKVYYRPCKDMYASGIFCLKDVSFVRDLCLRQTRNYIDEHDGADDGDRIKIFDKVHIKLCSSSDNDEYKPAMISGIDKDSLGNKTYRVEYNDGTHEFYVGRNRIKFDASNTINGTAGNGGVKKLKQMKIHSEIYDVIKKLLHLRVPQYLQTELKFKNDAFKTRCDAVKDSTAVTNMLNDLYIPSNKVNQWKTDVSKLMVESNDLIGLRKTKAYVQSLVSDTIGRIRLQEKPPLRHVVITGEPGTGKRESAKYIGKWRDILCCSSAFPKPKGLSTSSSAPDAWSQVGRIVELVNLSVGDASSGPLKKGQYGRIEKRTNDTVTVKGWSYKNTAVKAFVPKNCIDVKDLEQLEEYVEALAHVCSPTYYLNLPELFQTTDEPLHLSDLLTTLEETSNACMILGGHEDVVSKWVDACPFFRKTAPSVIALPVIEQKELALISLLHIEHRGYKLSIGGKLVDHSSSDERLAFMEQIVKQKYGANAIKERNAYLAEDCVDIAVGRKNLRLADLEDAQIKEFEDNSEEAQIALLAKSPLPFVLIIDDFDVKTETKEEREAKREAVDKKIAEMENWGSPDVPNSPHYWFATQRRVLLAHSDDALELNPWDFNVVVEAGPGAGKTTFASLAAEFLHAYGVIEGGHGIKKKAASDLLGDSYESVEEVKKKTSAAFAKDNALLVTQAERIAPSTTNSSGSHVGEVIAIEAASAPFIVLSCDEGTARGVLTSHNDLESKFPHLVKIEDPSVLAFCATARRYSEKDRKMAWADGLLDQIEAFVRENMALQSGKIPQGMRVAKSFVDAAIRKQSERMAGVAKSEFSTDKVELIAADFEIGKELGDTEAKEAVYKEMEEMVGIESAKEWLTEVRRQIDFANITGSKASLKRCYNLVLTGKPGTGKTTFARLVHKFLKAHGVLTGEFVEKNALELKGEYVGSTTPLVKACFAEAKGGTLFLDEAYGLSSDGFKNGGDSFSKEAVRTLLTEVENNRTSTVVILAGYEDKMKHLLRADPGLPRRFPNNIHLNSYSPDQLALIATHCAKSRFGKSFEDGLEKKLSKWIAAKYRREIDMQNGGLSVNLVEAAVASQESRIMEEMEKSEGSSSTDKIKAAALLLSRTQQLVEKDFGMVTEKESQELGCSDAEKAQIEMELSDLIGMKNVKEFFHKLKDTATFVEMTGKMEALGGCLHLVLTGNPGTGKTTTARLISRYLHTFGILPSSTFKEINGLQLKGQYVGQTSHHVSEIVNDALGGCLFIDEAYSLIGASGGGDAFGQEVIRTLLTEVENHRSDLLVIMAGYEGPMEDLLDADPGLRSRFSTRLHLVDYDAHEISEIAERTARKKNFVFEEGLCAALGQHIKSVHGDRISTENGRLAVNLVDRAVESLASRLVRSGLGKEQLREQMN
jgi:SpoVK/Ycf46/Vps4 family AAA+-type ATPase